MGRTCIALLDYYWIIRPPETENEGHAKSPPRLAMPKSPVNNQLGNAASPPKVKGPPSPPPPQRYRTIRELPALTVKRARQTTPPILLSESNTICPTCQQFGAQSDTPRPQNPIPQQVRGQGKVPPQGFRYGAAQPPLPKIRVPPPTSNGVIAKKSICIKPILHESIGQCDIPLFKAQPPPPHHGENNQRAPANE